MPNPLISQITLPSGTTYDIADLAARAAAAGIAMVKCTNAANTPAGVEWMSGTTKITGTLAASANTTGKFYLVSVQTDPKDIYAEYVTVIDDSVTPNAYSWEKIGTTDIDLSDLGALAYKDSASATYTPAGTVGQAYFVGTGKKFVFTGSNSSFGGSFKPSGSIAVNESSGSGTSYTPQGSIAVNASSGTGTSYTPEGTVSQPTFTGSQKSVSVSGTLAKHSITLSATAPSDIQSPSSYTPTGSIAVNDSSGTGTSYTPQGTVSAPTISKSSAGSTTSITPFGTAGSLPSLSMTVSDGNLAISFDKGTLPTAGTAVTVKTGDASYTSSAPTFTGTEKKLSFTGTKVYTYDDAHTVSSSGQFTPEGTVSQPTFSGTGKKFAFSGTEKKFAFSGTSGSVSVSGTPEGNIFIYGTEVAGGTVYTPEGTIPQQTFTGTQATITST